MFRYKASIGKWFALLCLLRLLVPTASSGHASECSHNLSGPFNRSPQKRSLPEKKILVVVDGYSSGRLIPQAARERARMEGGEVFIVHVHSSGEPPEIYKSTWHPERFDLDIAHRGYTDHTVYQIEDVVSKQNGQLLAVIPGTETGVLVADKLATKLGKKHKIPSNGVELGRRNKYIMMERLREHGVDTVNQFLSSSLDKIKRWIKREKLLTEENPIIVVKPVSSASGEDVRFCSTLVEVAQAYRQILNKKNEFGELNSEVLVQEFLEGQEYVVDSVSALNPSTGQPHVVVTDIWKYHKRLSDRGNQKIYWYDELVSPHSVEVPSLVDYNRKVLEALAITTGLGHAEIMLTDRGPVLVEIGARAMGAQQPAFVKDVLGQSQIELGMTSLWNPELYSQTAPLYQMNESAIVYTLKTKRAGSYLHGDAREFLQNIPGYVNHRFFFEEGEALPETVDLNTGVGDVWIKGNALTVQSALQRLMEIETEGLLERDSLN